MEQAWDEVACQAQAYVVSEAHAIFLKQWVFYIGQVNLMSGNPLFISYFSSFYFSALDINTYYALNVPCWAKKPRGHTSTPLHNQLSKNYGTVDRF